LRADVLALAMNGYVVIVEVKSCLQDLRTDNKLELYKEFCNQLYIALPKSAYEKAEDRSLIPPGVGVFIMSEDGRTVLKVKAVRKRDVDPSVVFNLAIRCAFRDSDGSTRKNKNALLKDDQEGC
jgi:hypothetical protein